VRKKDKEILDRRIIDKIIRSCLVCRVGFSLSDQPYIVPMNFGYDGQNLYFHTAREGRKVEMIEANNRVCFEFDTDVQIVQDDVACKWTCQYKSVIGFGWMCELKSELERISGLNQIMIQYSGRTWEFDRRILSKARIWKLNIEEVTLKQSLHDTN